MRMRKRKKGEKEGMKEKIIKNVKVLICVSCFGPTKNMSPRKQWSSVHPRISLVTNA